MIKRFLVAIVALSMAVASFSACAARNNNSSSSSDSSSGDTLTAEGGITSEQAASVNTPVSLTINGEEIDTTDLVVCTINGIDVSFDEYRYYWLNYYDTYSSAGFDMSSDETLEAIKSSIENDLVNQYGIIALGIENGVEFGDDVQQTADEEYDALLASFDSVESYQEALLQTYMTDKFVRDYYYYAVYSDQVVDFLLSDASPYIKTSDDLLKAIEDGEFSRTLNLLVTFAGGAELSDEDLEAWDELTVAEKSDKYTSAYGLLSEEDVEAADERAKEIAEEALAKAKAGEDFYKLINEYNLDPGMTPNDPGDITSIDGYYITKDYSFVQEYIDAAFALEENEVSDIVETYYGYHIIKRLPIDMDYVNANLDSMTTEYSDTYLNKVVYEYLEAAEVVYFEYYDDLTFDSIK